MLEKIKSALSMFNDWKFFVPIIAAIVMWFTPDSVDNIIESTLKTLGLKVYKIEEDLK
jgi:hypothetical protein